MHRPFVYAPPKGPLAYIYQDEHFLIINKPAGLLSVPGKPDTHKDCLEARVQAQHPSARIVHRLDLATSGIMVMAMNKAAHRHIGLQFERRHIEKSYSAKVWGKPKNAHGKINLPLICDWPNRPMQKVDHESGKRACTDWEVLKSNGQTSLLRLTPKTGRSHQLRVHLNEIGYPILGDNLYAHDAAFAAADRLCLHAQSLSFYHPIGGDKVYFECPCPF